MTDIPSLLKELKESNLQDALDNRNQFIDAILQKISSSIAQTTQLSQIETKVKDIEETVERIDDIVSRINSRELISLVSVQSDLVKDALSRFNKK